VLGLFALPVQAQLSSGAQSSGMGAAMAKLYGASQAFTAKCEMRILEKGKESMRVTMNYAFDRNKIRMEMELAQVKSAELTAEAVGQMKALGLDRTTTIVRLDKKVMLTIFPSAKAYVEMPLPPEEAKASESNLKVEKKSAGKETIDGHPCVKQNVTMTGDGVKYDMVIWEATDLKNFPIQVQYKEGLNTVMTLYRSLKFADVPGGDFEPPAGFVRHNSQQEMVQAMMQQALQKQLQTK
jgi:hypothetical protein